MQMYKTSEYVYSWMLKLHYKFENEIYTGCQDTAATFQGKRYFESPSIYYIKLSKSSRMSSSIHI